MPDPLKSMTDWDQLKAMLAKKADAGAMTKIDEPALLAHLQSRVKGQDAVLKDVARLIRLQTAKQQKERPICNLLFLGPTGTGKTELAKAIAEYLFKDEKAMVRFDCNEMSAPESKIRLIGHPPGYLSAEQGGELTRAVMSNPRRLILFDEIEKAHPLVFDIFLSLMGEGRVTEQGSGKVVDCTQCLIILTSNAHGEEIGQLQRDISDPYELINAVKGYLADRKVFRPEIVARFDKVYVFQPLVGMVIAEIALLKIASLGKQYGLAVQFVAPELLLQVLAANDKVSRFGTRELQHILDEMLPAQFIEAKEAGAKNVLIEADEVSGEVRVKPVEG